jgi:MoaA/NifB/PqqE/SkfB family radical SAM enzyme
MLNRAVRYAHAAGRIAVAATGVPRAPLKLTFAVTYRCQYRCATCNIWTRRPDGELTTDEVLAFVARNSDASWLDLTGGEIFLRPDIETVLDAIVRTWRRLVVLHYPTNGFLTDRIVRTTAALAGRGPAQLIVTVSVDGDEVLNDRVRGIRGGFTRQLATFRALRAIHGVRAVIGMTLSRANAGRFESTFDACRAACPDLTIDDFHVNVAQVSDHYYGNAGMATGGDAVAADLARYVARRGPAYSPSAWLESRYLRGLSSFMETGTTPEPCHALRSSCFIDPYGVVYPCLSYSRPIGSLRDHGMSLAPLWAAASTRTLQSDISGGDCPQCWTACDAYPTILGNLLRPRRAAVRQPCATT